MVLVVVLAVLQGRNITVMQVQEDVFYQDQEDLEEMLEVMLSVLMGLLVVVEITVAVMEATITKIVNLQWVAVAVVAGVRQEDTP